MVRPVLYRVQHRLCGIMPIPAASQALLRLLRGQRLSTVWARQRNLRCVRTIRMTPPNLRKNGIASGLSSQFGQTSYSRISQPRFFFWRYHGKDRDEIATSGTMRTTLWKRAFTQFRDLFVCIRRVRHLFLSRTYASQRCRAAAFAELICSATVGSTLCF